MRNKGVQCDPTHKNKIKWIVLETPRVFQNPLTALQILKHFIFLKLPFSVKAEGSICMIQSLFIYPIPLRYRNMRLRSFSVCWCLVCNVTFKTYLHFFLASSVIPLLLGSNVEGRQIVSAITVVGTRGKIDLNRRSLMSLISNRGIAHHFLSFDFFFSKGKNN